MNGRAVRVFPLALAACAGSRADVATLEPGADAFVCAWQPAYNFGAAGAIAVADAGMAQGAFEGLLRFDAQSARAGFDAGLGAGQWEVLSVTLRLTATIPANPIFNASTAGPFLISWLANDNWDEGMGSPAVPTTEGVAFNDVPALVAAGEEGLGQYTFDGSTSGTAVWDLSPSPGLRADIHAGSTLTLRMHGAGSPFAYIFRSRNYPTASAHPTLTITAALIEPPCYANCDGSTTPPVLNVLDFGCFLNRFAAGDSTANCDGSTTQPVLNVLDFSCFLNRFAAGCT